MRKKEHSGSAAVIGAQLVILFILTVSLCVQSRKAAAENTYAVMEKSGEGSRAGWNRIIYAVPVCCTIMI